MDMNFYNIKNKYYKNRIPLQYKQLNSIENLKGKIINFNPFDDEQFKWIKENVSKYDKVFIVTHQKSKPEWEKQYDYYELFEVKPVMF